MVEKPKAITTIGIVQILLAATFVVWLVFFPSTGWNFAWPVTPAFSAMFIGAGFIARTYIGYYLWREKRWGMLRWQVNANYAFLFVIFLATYWHVDEMNWKSNIIVAHIWVLAYTIEPIMLYLLEPRGEANKTPLPAEFQQGPVLPGLKRVAVAGLVVAATLAGLFFINPRFMNTRWPWPLDPFNARIMAAFLILAAAWCREVYFAEQWVEIKRAVFGLLIFSTSNFVLWLLMYPQFDPARKNGLTFGIVFGVFAILLAYYSFRQERAHKLAGQSIPALR
jgi:hypothetical protein